MISEKGKVAILLLIGHAYWLQGVQANALEPSVCPLGEDPSSDGIVCHGSQMENDCREYCFQRFGPAVYGSCTRYENTEQAQCLCETPCTSASIYGDPHIRSFDNMLFEYHGVCKHVVVKPTRAIKGVPHFEVTAKNRVWNDTGVTVPDVLEIQIEPWAIHIRIGKEVQINDNQRALPFRYSHVRNGKTEFFEITSFRDHSRSVVKVVTSFGLIVIKAQPAEVDYRYAHNVYIYLPRIAEFKGNVIGLLGNMDGNPENDYGDGRGNLYQKSDINDWAVGDQYCLDPQEILDQNYVAALRQTEVAYSKQHQKRMEACEADAEKNQHRLKCEDLGNEELEQCLGQAVLDTYMANCKVDVCYAPPGVEKLAFCNILEVAARPCPVTPDCV